jgi:hypothetical protein
MIRRRPLLRAAAVGTVAVRAAGRSSQKAQAQSQPQAPAPGQQQPQPQPQPPPPGLPPTGS